MQKYTVEYYDENNEQQSKDIKAAGYRHAKLCVLYMWEIPEEKIIQIKRATK